MTKLHLKRLNAPITWNIKKKENAFIMRPNASGHKMINAMPLSVLFKDILNLAKTTKEVKDIVNNKEIIVDGKRRKNVAYAVGLMDVVECVDINKVFRLLINKKGKLIAQEIDSKEKDLKPLKIINKTVVKKGKMQLNCSDGRNIFVEKNDYKTNDVIVVNIKENKITDHLKCVKGNYVYIIGGKYVGKQGVVETVDSESVAFKTKNGEFIETAKRYMFIIGKEKPCIKLPDKD